MSNLITFIIKRGSFWQDGKQRYAEHPDKSLRTVSLTEEDRNAMDPTHSDLQSSAEAGLEAKKLEVDAGLAQKRADALAKFDAEHASELEAEEKAKTKKEAEEKAKTKKEAEEKAKAEKEAEEKAKAEKAKKDGGK